MGRRKKLINNTNIPQYKIESIARCILPDILEFYESEEGQKEFAEWKAKRDRNKLSRNKGDCRHGGASSEMVMPRRTFCLKKSKLGVTFYSNKIISIQKVSKVYAYSALAKQ